MSALGGKADSPTPKPTNTKKEAAPFGTASPLKISA
jgi:hypothetical protein